MAGLKRFSVLYLFSLFVVFGFFGCSQGIVEEKKEAELLYRNHAADVKYVGAQECKKCHKDKFDTFIHTEMGRSLKKGRLHGSSAQFHQSHLVFDDDRNLFYHPFVRDSALYLKEFRVDDRGDTSFIRIEKLDFIVGSGQHTNSHFVQQNGYVYQAPITWYAQKGEWHLPPGFEGGNNSRFSRLIGEECMTCHNGYAEFVEGSKNRFTRIPEGIDCERCHGPGALHVQEKLAGNLVDVTTGIDYSIVNPAKLSSNLQMDVCQRCHLQGISAMKEGKNYRSFLPGMELNSMYEVFQARFKDSDQSFIMASHSDRLQMSKCFIKSRKNDEMKDLTCITCHNPHLSVTEVETKYFNSKCVSCHKEMGCSEQEEVITQADNNCVVCHMKKASSYDIPHVNITDHNIAKRPVSRAVDLAEVAQSEQEKQKDFIKLFCRTNDAPSYLSSAKAYLNYFEKYAKNRILLDTAQAYLSKSTEVDSILNKYWIRLHFLKQDYEKVVQLSKGYSGVDAWSNYRIGQSFYNLGKVSGSIAYFEQAIASAPFDLDFHNKLALAYQESGQLEKAKVILEESLALNPKIAETNNQLGFCLVSLAFKGKVDLKNAEQYFLEAVALDPDYTKAKENLASLYLNVGNKEKAELYIRQLLQIDSDNETYLRFYKVLSIM